MRTAKSLLVAACVTVFALGGCETENGGAIGVSVDRIVDDPEAFYGSRVTVSGEVNDIYSPTTFTIGGGDFDEELLILSVDTIGGVAGRSEGEPVRKHDLVQITGTVRPFDAGEISDEFGLDLGTVDDEHEGRPVVIARSGSAQLPSIVVTPRGGTVAPPTEEQLVTDFAKAAGPDGRELAGRLAHFSDLRVAAPVGNQSFWATSGDSDSLFVVLTEGAVDAGEIGGQVMTRETWDVYGILRDVPPRGELAAEWGIGEETIGLLQDEAVFLQAIHAIRGDAIRGDEI